MKKINTVILSDDIDLRIGVKNLLRDDIFAISGYSGFGSEGKTKIMNLFPDVALCTVRGDTTEKVFTFVQDVLSTVHGTTMILVTDRITVELVNKAASYGIRKVIPVVGITAEQFSAELKQVFDLEQQRSLETNEGKKTRCKVFGFFSGKGGTGKTITAVNTAVSLARAGKRVMLIDLDLQFGDVAISLDIEPKYSIVDLVQDRYGITIENINSFALDHSSGVRVLCAPKSAEFAEYVKASHVEKIIDIMRPYYEYIIIDMASSFTEVSITACENCGVIFMIYNTDILSLNNAKSCCDILDRLHQKDKLKFVINKFEKGMIGPKDFAKLFDTEIYSVIPYESKEAKTSVNKGLPVVISQPHSSLAASFTKLSQRIISDHSGVEEIPQPKKGRKSVGSKQH